MPFKTPGIQVNPYTSTVPMVELPPQAMEASTRPAGPLAGEFGRPGTGELAIGDAILKGVMLGHQEKERRKAAQAEATIAAADQNTQSAYQNYQDALSAAGGNAKDPKAQAAYESYLASFNASKAAKAQYVIPQKGHGTKGEKKKEGLFGNIHEFFEANPHLIPQIALMTMQPKPQGMAPQTRLQNAEIADVETRGKLDTERLNTVQHAEQQQQEAEQRAARERQVEQGGGIDAVLANKSASPELQQTARRMKFASLDRMTPEGKMKYQIEQSLATAMQGGGGEAASAARLNPEQRVMAGEFGLLPKVQAKTVTGRNGNKYEIQYDPLTNQPVAGTTAMNLGPPEWENEFYAKRALAREDAMRDVQSNPQAYGVKITGNPQQDKANIEATAEHLFTMHEFGIRSLANQLGQTGYQVQRDNDWLTKAVNAFNKAYPTGQYASPDATAQFDWTGGQKVDLTKSQLHDIMGQFIATPTENAGVYGFRNTPAIPQGKDPAAVERDRKWLYQVVKNEMVNAKGKDRLTPDQADAILQTTALGKPIAIPKTLGGMTKPPVKGEGIGKRMESFVTGGESNVWGNATPSPRSMTPPPNAAQAGMKPYFVPGVEGMVMLSAEDAARAKQANVPIEDASSVYQTVTQQ